MADFPVTLSQFLSAMALEDRLVFSVYCSVYRSKKALQSIQIRFSELVDPLLAY